MSGRGEKVGERIRRELASLMVTELHDRRLAHVTLTAVAVTKDIGVARIYWTTNLPEAERKRIAEGFKSASGFIRKALAPRLGLRLMPRLEFFYDERLETIQRVETLLKKLKGKLKGSTLDS